MMLFMYDKAILCILRFRIIFKMGSHYYNVGIALKSSNKLEEAELMFKKAR